MVQGTFLAREPEMRNEQLAQWAILSREPENLRINIQNSEVATQPLFLGKYPSNFYRKESVRNRTRATFNISKKGIQVRLFELRLKT